MYYEMQVKQFLKTSNYKSNEKRVWRKLGGHSGFLFRRVYNFLKAIENEKSYEQSLNHLRRFEVDSEILRWETSKYTVMDSQPIPLVRVTILTTVKISRDCCIGSEGAQL